MKLFLLAAVVVAASAETRFTEECCNILNEAHPIEQCLENVDKSYLDCVAEKGECEPPPPGPDGPPPPPPGPGPPPPAPGPEGEIEHQIEECIMNAIENSACMVGVMNDDIVDPCGNQKELNEHPGWYCYDTPKFECSDATEKQMEECYNEAVAMEEAEGEPEISDDDKATLNSCFQDVCTEGCDCVVEFGNMIIGCIPEEVKAELTEEEQAEMEEIQGQMEEAAGECYDMCSQNPLPMHKFGKVKKGMHLWRRLFVRREYRERMLTAKRKHLKKKAMKLRQLKQQHQRRPNLLSLAMAKEHKRKHGRYPSNMRKLVKFN